MHGMLTHSQEQDLHAKPATAVAADQIAASVAAAASYYCWRGSALQQPAGVADFVVSTWLHIRNITEHWTCMCGKPGAPSLVSTLLDTVSTYKITSLYGGRFDSDVNLPVAALGGEA